MSNGFKVAIAATILAMSGAIGVAVAADGEEAIKMRVDHMKTHIAKPFGAIKNFVEKGEGTAEDVEKNAKMLSDAALKIPEGFPKGTARGDYDEKMTRALPKIWENWADFESKAKALSDEAATLALVAAGDDAEAIKAQFVLVGKNGCGACHKDYRGDQVK